LEASVDIWLEYILRFSHLVSGIAWIGSSFYFIWLDSSFLPPEVPRKNVEGEVFMVHGGFYYQVEKKKIYPGEIPKILHWFKWEATLTWVTGFMLLILLYFMRGASLLVDPRIHQMTQANAVMLALGLIVGSWVFYDLTWKFISSKAINTFLSVIYFCGLIYTMAQIFSGRGTFILTGAIFGSMMVLNVWHRILPGQSKMLKEAQAGQVPDYSVSIKSKTRSVHNTYFTFPVLFIMLSNHYGTIYNHPQNWLLLILLCVSGALVRHAMVTKRPVERWTLLPAALGLGGLVYMTAATFQPVLAQAGGVVSIEQVKGIVQQRCWACHSTHNTDDVFKVPQKGLVFETEDLILANKNKIYEQVVVNRIMPFANKTNMTDEERNIIAQWAKQ
jgi:uncharacterized membrane protein